MNFVIHPSRRHIKEIECFFYVELVEIREIVSEFALWFLKFEYNFICGGEEILEAIYHGVKGISCSRIVWSGNMSIRSVWIWSSFIASMPVGFRRFLTCWDMLLFRFFSCSADGTDQLHFSISC